MNGVRKSVVPLLRRGHVIDREERFGVDRQREMVLISTARTLSNSNSSKQARFTRLESGGGVSSLSKLNCSRDNPTRPKTPPTARRSIISGTSLMRLSRRCCRVGGNGSSGATQPWHQQPSIQSSFRKGERVHLGHTTLPSVLVFKEMTNFVRDEKVISLYPRVPLIHLPHVEIRPGELPTTVTRSKRADSVKRNSNRSWTDCLYLPSK